MKHSDHQSSRCVDNVIGAFMLIRAEVLSDVGGFDEGFFVFLEDIDLSTRAKEVGWQVFYDHNPVVYHEGGVTTRSVKGLRLYYSLDSRFEFARKSLSNPKVAAYTFSLLSVGAIPRLVWHFLHADFEGVRKMFLAFSNLYRTYVFKK